MSSVLGAGAEFARGGRLPRSARRKQLLAAAQEVFVANGYHAAAMDDIAERAGVSKPVLYQHFPGKLELYLALLDTQADALARAVHTALAATEDNQKRVHGVLTAYFDFVGRDEGGGAYRLIFETDLGNDPAVRARLEGMTRKIWRTSPTRSPSDTGLGRDEAATAGDGAHRRGPGGGELVAGHRRPGLAGRRGAAARVAAVAGDLELPAARRPPRLILRPVGVRCRRTGLCGRLRPPRLPWTPQPRRTTGGPAWRSRSVFCTPRARSWWRARRPPPRSRNWSPQPQERRRAVGAQRRQGPQGHRAGQPDRLRRDRPGRRAPGRVRLGLSSPTPDGRSGAAASRGAQRCAVHGLGRDSSRGSTGRDARCRFAAAAR